MKIELKTYKQNGENCGRARNKNNYSESNAHWEWLENNISREDREDRIHVRMAFNIGYQEERNRI